MHYLLLRITCDVVPSNLRNVLPLSGSVCIPSKGANQTGDYLQWYEATRSVSTSIGMLDHCRVSNSFPGTHALTHFCPGLKASIKISTSYLAGLFDIFILRRIYLTEYILYVFW